MKYKTISGIIICTITIFSTPSYAELKPEDEIKYRQSAMMFMRWNMGKIKKQVVKNPETYNKEQIISSANVIASVANSGLGKLFSEKTKKGKGWKETRIKSEFFEQPDEVKKRANIFKDEANKLAKVANTGNIDKIKNQFDKTFKACKGCHKKFRKKEPK